MIHYPFSNQQEITFMTEMHSYKINQRALSMFGALANDVLLKNDKNYLFDLSYMGLIAVNGEKAAEFLQGQLSCDMKQVSNTQMRQGLMCNLKGRLLAMLDVFYCQNKLYLNLPEDLLEPSIESLAKTALFSRVKLEASRDFKLYGFYCQNPGDILPDAFQLSDKAFAMIQTESYCAYHLGQGLYILLIIPENETLVKAQFEKANQYRSALAWHALNLSHSRVSIYPETRGLFLAHRLDLHNKDYISFNKGCYKGQEIIARTHYKAKLKHELALYTVKTKEQLFAGQKIFDEKGQSEVAELIDYAPLGEDHYLIALSILNNYSGDEVTVQTQEQALVKLLLRS